MSKCCIDYFTPVAESTFLKINRRTETLLQTLGINLEDREGQPGTMALTCLVKKSMHKLDFCLKYPEPVFVPN